jgi:hypothetical protein
MRKFDIFGTGIRFFLQMDRLRLGPYLPFFASFCFYANAQIRILQLCTLFSKCLRCKNSSSFEGEPQIRITGGLECVGHSFAYVANCVFLRDVWIRTQRATVARRRAINLATHHPTYPTNSLQIRIIINGCIDIMTTNISKLLKNCE